jgi:sterol desaturase/sphingolipid hydroxylase (fatty acid hydroxylase superfamily)
VTDVRQPRPIAIAATMLAMGATVTAALSWPEAVHDPKSAAYTALSALYASLAWLISKSVENFAHNALALLATPVTFGDRLHWVNLLGFVVLSAVAILIHQRAGSRMRIGWFLRFVFPPEYYRHPSAVVDYQIFIINRILTPAKLVTRALSDMAIAGFILSALTAAFGPPVGIALPAVGGILLYTLLVVLVSDFSGWAGHVVMHRVPVLWEFHKLHHSAEVLTPITYYRIHPVEEMIAVITSVLISGSFSGVLAYLILEQPSLLTIFGVNVFVASFQLMGNLRHSHIWLSWGQTVSRILISPAQHQIHHSVDPRHRGKNYGSIFAIWDWMFGTLYVPKEKEELKFGLPGPQIHRNVGAAYLYPFQAAWRVLRLPLRAPRAPTRSVAVIAVSETAERATK